MTQAHNHIDTPKIRTYTRTHYKYTQTQNHLLVESYQPEFLLANCWPLEGGGSSQGRQMMKEGPLPTKKLSDINWGAFKHAFHAPHVHTCTHPHIHTTHDLYIHGQCVCVFVCVYMCHTCTHTYTLCECMSRVCEHVHEHY